MTSLNVTPHAVKKTVKLLVLVSLICALPVHAAMVALYIPKESTMRVEELKKLALSVREKREIALPEAFTYKTSDAAVLTEEFSVPEGMSAYFWADETFSRDGYVMGGEGAHYEADFPLEEEALAKEALDVVGPDKVYPTEFRMASIMAGSLNLTYSVTKPGQVSIEAYGMNGQRVGHWRVPELAGEHTRSFELNVTTKGPLYIRWMAGNTQAVRRVLPATAIQTK